MYRRPQPRRCFFQQAIFQHRLAAQFIDLIGVGLALQQHLECKNVEPRCALQVINLKTGDIVHELRIEGVVEELYDVCVLSGVKLPMAVGFVKDEIRHTLLLPEIKSTKN